MNTQMVPRIEHMIVISHCRVLRNKVIPSTLMEMMKSIEDVAFANLEMWSPHHCQKNFGYEQTSLK